MVDQVKLWIEQTEVALDVLSSRGDGRGVDSVAVGTVAAPLVRAFAQATTRSVTVLTSAGGTLGTTTRIGNAGLGKVFGGLETACGRAKRDVHARVEAAAR
jgi:hypothetical protein